MMTASKIEKLEITKDLINMNYTKAIKIKPRFIVVHGIKERIFKTPKQYRDYMATNEDAKQSVHYIIGKDEIIQPLEEDWRALHVGDKPSKVVTNSNSIGIALLLKNESEKEEVYEKATALLSVLKSKYDIEIKHILRHYDVTGKNCPEQLIDNKVWNDFKGRIAGNLPKKNTPKGSGKIIDVLSKLNIRKEPNNSSQTIGTIKKGEEFYIYDILEEWVKIIKQEDNNVCTGYLNRNYVEISLIRNREISLSVIENKSINIENEVKHKTIVGRGSEPNMGVQERRVLSTKVINRVAINKVGRVINVDTNLNVRRGPGMEHFVIAYLLGDELVHVVDMVGEWYKIIFNSTIGKRVGFVEKDNITIKNA